MIIFSLNIYLYTIYIYIQYISIYINRRDKFSLIYLWFFAFSSTWKLITSWERNFKINHQIYIYIGYNIYWYSYFICIYINNPKLILVFAVMSICLTIEWSRCWWMDLEDQKLKKNISWLSLLGFIINLIVYNNNITANSAIWTTNIFCWWPSWLLIFIYSQTMGSCNLCLFDILSLESACPVIMYI